MPGVEGNADGDQMAFVTAIGVPTGGRPEDLRRLLSALAADYGAREDVRLIVADNTADGSARPIFEELTAPFGSRAVFVHEPDRGYANVRNAVTRGLGDASALAMIDDDEVPAPGWLDSLIAARDRFDADVVAGPIVREFPSDVPGWYASSGVFGLEAPDYEEGAEMPWCASNNTLVLASVFERVPEGFDVKFNRMSGEDTQFFMRAKLRGCKIVWTHTAVVHEYLPHGRFSREWVLNRAIRAGNSRALIEAELRPGVATRAKRLAKMTGVLGLALVSAAMAGARRDRALGLRSLHRFGLVYGMARAFGASEPWSPP